LTNARIAADAFPIEVAKRIAYEVRSKRRRRRSAEFLQTRCCTPFAIRGRELRDERGNCCRRSGWAESGIGRAIAMAIAPQATPAASIAGPEFFTL
jgi:hypothetical protein